MINELLITWPLLCQYVTISKTVSHSLTKIHVSVLNTQTRAGRALKTSLVSAVKAG